jgi:adenosylcobinamide-GDP ribazoletransferase
MKEAPLLARLNDVRMGFLTLTRLPMGVISGAVPSMAASAWSWPLVGAVVGATSGLIYCAALWLGIAPMLAAALAIATLVLVTGGLHEDGLADLADGFGGGRDRARVLEIMRDSRIGSYGAIAIGFSLLIRVVALGGLGACAGFWALIGLGAASRAGLPAVLRMVPSARDDGLGHAASGVSAQASILALTLGFLALLPLGLSVAFCVAVAVACVTAGLGLWAKARIGGQTGDVLGAMCQLGEIAGWLVVSAHLQAA